jgi:glutamyl-tRNA synthetase
MSLTLSSRLQPFPFSVIGVVAYTGIAEIIYDENATGITLELDGHTLRDEHDIVQVIGRAGNLREDTNRVRYSRDNPIHAI